MKRTRPAVSVRSSLSGAGHGGFAIGVDDPVRLGLLGIPDVGQDPVTIITAAQVRLRRWRRVLTSDGGHAPSHRAAAVNDRIRKIAAARDELLQQAFLARRGAGRG